MGYLLRESGTSSRLTQPETSEVVETRIKWDKDIRRFFYHLCVEEIKAHRTRVGELSSESLDMIWENFVQAGKFFDKTQLKRRWEAAKKLHSFWYRQVLSETGVKTDSWWEKKLKKRAATLEYKNLQNGPPDDIDLLDTIFGAIENEKGINEELEKKIQSLEEDNASLNDRLKVAEALITEKDNQICEAEELRKKLNSTILELKGNMRVVVRVRPPLKGSEDSNNMSHISYPESFELRGRGINLVEKEKVISFSFDKVFGPKTNQAEVYDEVSELVQSSIDGFKVCIFSYGQTGAGKTYTMIGTPGEDTKGIIPRALEQIFDHIHSMKEWMYDVHVSVAEVYLSDVYDLLARDDMIHNFDFVETLVSNGDHAYTILDEAVSRRFVRHTNMNDKSSRSHFMFRLRISGFNKVTSKKSEGFLNVLDLAGSERPDKSGSVDGTALKEAKAINSSLSFLVDVMVAIRNKDNHIPFRNTILTQLLQPYLTNGPKTLMLVNISPELSSVSESISSLRFGETVKICEIGRPKRGGAFTPLKSPKNLLPPKQKDIKTLTALKTPKNPLKRKDKRLSVRAGSGSKKKRLQ